MKKLKFDSVMFYCDCDAEDLHYKECYAISASNNAQIIFDAWYKDNIEDIYREINLILNRKKNEEE